MSDSKIKIIRVLTNPKGKRGRRKTASQVRRQKAIKRKPRVNGAPPAAGATLFRAIVPKGAGFGYLWWSGKKWTAQRKQAERFRGLPKNTKAALDNLPAGWIDATLVPA